MAEEKITCWRPFPSPVLEDYAVLATSLCILVVASFECFCAFPGACVMHTVFQWLSGKESDYNAGAAGDASTNSGSGRFPGEGLGNPLQYSCLENSRDRRAWGATVTGVAKCGTWLKRLSTARVMHVRIYVEYIHTYIHRWLWRTAQKCCQEELPRSGAGTESARLRGATPRPRSGAAAARAKEGQEELLHVQGQEGQPWGDTSCPR